MWLKVYLLWLWPRKPTRIVWPYQSECNYHIVLPYVISIKFKDYSKRVVRLRWFLRIKCIACKWHFPPTTFSADVYIYHMWLMLMVVKYRFAGSNRFCIREKCQEKVSRTWYERRRQDIDDDLYDNLAIPRTMLLAIYGEGLRMRFPRIHMLVHYIYTSPSDLSAPQMKVFRSRPLCLCG